MRLYLLVGLLFCGISALDAATDKVVCYYGSWATYRTSSGKYDIEDINPSLCTHIIYSFVGLEGSTSLLKILDSYADISLQGYKRFANLKQRNPNVKLMIAIGGWNEGSAKYSSMASTAETRKAFIESVVLHMKTYGFDGFDIDWEYPTLRGGSPDDRVNYISLLQDMRTRFDNEGFLLSIAVAATSDYHRSAYNVPEINKYVDFVNLMSYDMHASWDGQTGHNAPLYPASWEVSSSYLSQLNVDACVRGWLDSGLDPDKLIMGVPAYGHTFTLASTSSTGVGVRTIGGGNAGPYTFESGTLSYLEICERFKAGGYTKYWDDVQKVPYAVNGNQWISYDDVTSIELKIAYAKSKKLGGVMLWSLESDDDRNLCGGGLYTIGTAVYNAVFGSSPPPTSPTTVKPTTTTTPNPVTTTTAKTVTTTTAKPATTTTTQKPAVTTTTQKPATTTTPSETLICPSSGFKRDPTNCGAFYQCYPGQPVNYAWRLLCQSGLYFDESSSTCNWSFLVSC